MKFFAFEINEYNYRVIHFTVHKTREAAERRASRGERAFRHEESSVTADVTGTVVAGEEAFEKWAHECFYRIDWKQKVLIYHEPERCSQCKGKGGVDKEGRGSFEHNAKKCPACGGQGSVWAKGKKKP